MEEIVMRILNQSRPYLFIIFVITLVLSTTSWAKQNKIIKYRVLSQSQSEVEIMIYSNYIGNHGPKAALSVLPTFNNQSVPVGYSACRSSKKSNYLYKGKNTTCFALKANANVYTNRLQVCMFELSSGRKFWCENFKFNKKWVVHNSSLNQHPVNQKNHILGFRVLSESQNELMIEVQSYYTGNHGKTANISVLPTFNGKIANVGYSAGRCPNSNKVFVGRNKTCITLSSTIRGSQFVTNGLQICMFGGPSGGSFHCENLAHTKRWGPAVSQSQPAGGGLIYVTTSVNPPVVSRGQQTLVRVYVHDGQGRPLPEAMVTLSSGGGRFARTGTPSASGLTDTSGSFADYWSCDPCSRAYVNGVKVTKPGYTEASVGWRVDIH
jgi:hypothetical protein